MSKPHKASKLKSGPGESTPPKQRGANAAGVSRAQSAKGRKADRRKADRIAGDALERHMAEKAAQADEVVKHFADQGHRISHADALDMLDYMMPRGGESGAASSATPPSPQGGATSSAAPVAAAPAPAPKGGKSRDAEAAQAAPAPVAVPAQQAPPPPVAAPPAPAPPQVEPAPVAPIPVPPPLPGERRRDRDGEGLDEDGLRPFGVRSALAVVVRAVMMALTLGLWGRAEQEGDEAPAAVAAADEPAARPDLARRPSLKHAEEGAPKSTKQKPARKAITDRIWPSQLRSGKQALRKADFSLRPKDGEALSGLRVAETLTRLERPKTIGRSAKDALSNPDVAYAYDEVARTCYPTSDARPGGLSHVKVDERPIELVQLRRSRVVRYHAPTPRWWVSLANKVTALTVGAVVMEAFLACCFGYREWMRGATDVWSAIGGATLIAFLGLVPLSVVNRYIPRWSHSGYAHVLWVGVTVVRSVAGAIITLASHGRDAPIVYPLVMSVARPLASAVIVYLCGVGFHVIAKLGIVASSACALYMLPLHARALRGAVRRVLRLSKASERDLITGRPEEGEAEAFGPKEAVALYCPNLLSSLLLECRNTPEVLAISGRQALLRLISPLGIPAALSAQVMEGTYLVAEKVLSHREDFLSGPSLAGAGGLWQ